MQRARRRQHDPIDRNAGGLAAAVVALVLGAGTAAGAVYYIDTCANLNESGATYYLTADIVNSEETACINITADNIVFDGQGHTIDGNFTLNGASSGMKYGVYSNSANATIKNCVISNWQNGVYLDTGADNSTVENNTISDIYGAVGTAGTNPGGDAVGIFVKSDNNKIVNNTMRDSTAGTGGTGGYCGSGGSGGTASGVYLSSSTNNTLTSNAISTLTAGAGGAAARCGSGGSGGTASGIWLDTNSQDNTITLTESRGSYHIPDSSELNTIEGKPILYFYNKANLNISHFNVTVSTIPILIGGSTQTGGPGGAGGKSTGIALINV